MKIFLSSLFSTNSGRNAPDDMGMVLLMAEPMLTDLAERANGLINPMADATEPPPPTMPVEYRPKTAGSVQKMDLYEQRPHTSGRTTPMPSDALPASTFNPDPPRRAPSRGSDPINRQLPPVPRQMASPTSHPGPQPIVHALSPKLTFRSTNESTESNRITETIIEEQDPHKWDFIDQKSPTLPDIGKFNSMVEGPWPLPLRIASPEPGSNNSPVETKGRVNDLKHSSFERDPSRSPRGGTPLPAVSPRQQVIEAITPAQLLAKLELDTMTPSPSSSPSQTPIVPRKHINRVNSNLSDSASRPVSGASSVTLAPGRSDTVSSRSSAVPPLPPKPQIGLFPPTSAPPPRPRRTSSLLELNFPKSPSSEKEVAVEPLPATAYYAHQEIRRPHAFDLPPSGPPPQHSPPQHPFSTHVSPLIEGQVKSSYPESIASASISIQASSQALPTSRSNSIGGGTGHDTASLFSVGSGPASTISVAEVVEVDFATLIPHVAYTGSSLPARFEEVGMRLRQDRAEILSSRDSFAHLAWAEEVLRHASVTDTWAKKLERVHVRAVPGPGFVQDLRLDARKIVDNLASDQNPRAVLVKARWFGLDEHETQQMYLSALSRGQNRAAFYLGKIYEKKGDIKTAYEYYRKGAYEQDSACSYVSGPPSIDEA
jgi:hypothetical protein